MANSCIKYETLIKALRETSADPQVDKFLKSYARGTVEFLEKSPDRAAVVRELLDNNSCTDISQIAQNLAAAARDASIAYRVGGYDLSQYFRELSRATFEVGEAAREVKGTAQDLRVQSKSAIESVGYAGREFGNSWKGIRDDFGYASMAFIAALGLALAIYGVNSVFGRRRG
jgi:hypothetical protein